MALQLIFDFDEAGERILVIGRHGLLFTWRIDGTDLEILPRPVVHGEVSRNPTTAIGVAGGFVVVSRRQGRLVLAHYDFPTRTCRVHTHFDSEAAESWVYYRDLHCVVARTETPDGAPGRAVDLLPLADRHERRRLPYRARRASKRAQKGVAPEPLIVREDVSRFLIDSWRKPFSTAVNLDPKNGTLNVRQSTGENWSLTPLRDGRPALERGNILQALWPRRPTFWRCWLKEGPRLVSISSRCRALSFSAPITTRRTNSAPAYSPCLEMANDLRA